MTKEIIEGNKLIAEFMGYIEVDGIKFCTDHINGHCNELEYHSSWDWLMPVVGKIIPLTENAPTEYYDGFLNELITCDIYNVWCEVVGFIKWYELQQEGDYDKDDFVSYMLSTSDYEEIDIREFADEYWQNMLPPELNCNEFIKWYDNKALNDVKYIVKYNKENHFLEGDDLNTIDESEIDQYLKWYYKNKQS